MICGALRNTLLSAPTFVLKSWPTRKTVNCRLGEHARLYFEDAKTIRYQIQEMLRIERVFEAEGIEEELSAYNPLIPDGHNWKATFHDRDPRPRTARHPPGRDDRHRRSSMAAGWRVWIVSCRLPMRISTEPPQIKPRLCTFMRFEVTPEQINALKDGAPLFAGVDHPSYPVDRYEVPQSIRDSLASDLS